MFDQLTQQNSSVSISIDRSENLMEIEVGASEKSYNVNPHKGAGLDSLVSTQTEHPTNPINAIIITRNRKQSNALFMVKHDPSQYEIQHQTDNLNFVMPIITGTAACGSLISNRFSFINRLIKPYDHVKNYGDNDNGK